MRISIKGKYLYLMVVTIIALLGIVLVPTYAKFTDNYITGDDIVGFNFDFDIEISNIEQYEEIEVDAGEMVRFNIDILNNTDSLVHYGIWYKLAGDSDLPSDNSIQIGRLKGTEVNSSGSIENNQSITGSFGIVNSTNKMIKFYIGVNGSNISIEDIEYLNGKKLITGEVNIIRDITINSIIIDGKKTDTLPKDGLYTMTSNCSRGSQLSWDTYTKSITYNVGAKAKDICSLEFTTSKEYKLLNEMSVGSYVKYIGSGGTVGTNNINCQISDNIEANLDINEFEAPNSCSGQNINENTDLSNYTYGYSGSSNYKYNTTGFRIAYIKDGKVRLISAGSPEVIYKNTATTNLEHIRKLNASALKYCNSELVDGNCSCDSTKEGECTTPSTDVWAFNDNDFYYMTKAISGYGKRLTSNSSTLGDVGGTLGNTLYCYNQYSVRECGYNNNLIDNGSAYWFATNIDGGTLFWNPNGRYVGLMNNNVHYGLRPVISLSSTVYVTGGTGTIDDPYTIENK